MQNFKVKTAVIGAGRGGSAFLPFLVKEPGIDLIGVSDINPDAPAFDIAIKHNIPVTNDFRDLLNKNPEIVINITGDDNVQSELLRYKSQGTEIIDGKSAKLVWGLLKKHQEARDEVKTLLNATKELYRIGISLLSADKLEDALNTLLTEACQTIGAPAGSIALYDEKNSLLTLKASHGFSLSFSRVVQWEVRDGGLTNHILSKRVPTIINDVEKNPFIDNRTLIKEGIKSLIAAPLFAGELIIGILYLDDFKTREWTNREIEFITLLGIQAAYAIEKFSLIETVTEADTSLKLKVDELKRTEMRLQSELLEREKAEEKMRQMSLTDELTGINNRRGFLTLAKQELEIAKRMRLEVMFLFADIDGLKWINDNLGHEKGDASIIDAANILKNTFRSSDIIARMGGDEFTVFAIKTPKSDTDLFVRRLQKNIDAHNEKSLRPYRLSLSVGFEVYDSADSRSVNELLSHADNLMYEQKRAKKQNSKQ